MPEISLLPDSSISMTVWIPLHPYSHTNKAKKLIGLETAPNMGYQTAHVLSMLSRLPDS